MIKKDQMIVLIEQQTQKLQMKWIFKKQIKNQNGWKNTNLTQ